MTHAALEAANAREGIKTFFYILSLFAQQDI